MPRVRVVSSGTFHEYRDLSRRLREAGSKDLQRDLRREIRKSGQPALSAARSAVQGVDMTSSRGGSAPPDTSTGLRARIAKATKLSVTATGIRFVVRESQVDPKYGQRLVQGSDGTPWQHPTFGSWQGNRKQTQVGEPWFYVTLRSYGPQFRRAAERAMQRTIDKIRG